MFCNACGSEMSAGQEFCTKCGKPVRTAVAPGQRNRVRQHIYSLAVLWIIYSVYRLVIRGLLLIPASALFGRIAHTPFFSDMPVGFGGFLGSMMVMVAVLTVIQSIAGLAVGVGLLWRAPWARVAALVLGFYSLIHPLLGTILGIYTLWVLLPQNSSEEYQALTHQTATA